jgi:vanillate O-demethylase ferredoxin subunit
MQPARIVAMREEAAGVLSLELQPQGAAVPAFGPGAHIELQLPGGLRRAYSLTNAPGERRAYRIAVHRSPASRGGSACVHGTLRVGDELPVSAPRNHFALSDAPGPVVLIAGGIGITPLWAMAQQLAQQQRPWTLHYAVRERTRAAFLGELQALDAARVHTYFDAEPGGRRLDLAALVAAQPADAQLYACGPAGLLQAFEAACTGRDPRHVHLERFAAAPGAPAAPAAALDSFDVVLARSGRTVRVPPGQSILASLLAAGVQAPSSCREGYCGTCETRVLDGVPAHADSVLSAAEKAAGRSLMICCSRSQTSTLVLEL